MKIAIFAVLGLMTLVAVVFLNYWVGDVKVPESASQVTVSSVPQVAPVPSPNTAPVASTADVTRDPSQRKIMLPSYDQVAVSPDLQPTQQTSSHGVSGEGFFASTWWLWEFFFAVLIGPALALGGSAVYAGTSKSYSPSGNWTGTTNYYVANPNQTAGMSGTFLLGLWLVGIFAYYFVARLCVPEMAGFWKFLGATIDSCLK